MTRRRILIVEDEAIVAMDIAARLERDGHVVVGTAATGARALALARAHQPDLVLMDIRLRGPVDGIATATELRLEQAVAIVFLSAHAEASTLAGARQLEPFGYVQKPFEDHELRRAIDQAVPPGPVDDAR